MTAPEQPAFQIEKGPIILAAILFGVGGLLAFLGLALGARAALSHGRRYVGTMDPPLSEVAQTMWGQLRAASKAACSAGADAWRTSTASGRGAPLDDSA